MERIRVDYTVTVSDFRKASYYGLFLRHRRPLQIMFAVLIGAILYGAGSYWGLGTANPLVFFLAAAYLCWGLLLFAGTERSIRQYMRAPGNFLGCTYTATLESHRVQIEIPERNIKASQQIGNLACVFELNQIFMIYVTAQDLYILPCRALTKEQRAELRQTFRQRLGNRFATRFH